MPVPQGFVELNPTPWAGGSWAVTVRDASGNDVFPATYPAFWRGRVLWAPSGALESIPLERQYRWPAWTLYGGPAPLGTFDGVITPWLRSWAATLPAKRAGGGWVILPSDPALLTPPQARPYPRSNFLWSWSFESEKPPRYNIEGNALAPLFRNTVTGSFDNPDFPMPPSPKVMA